MNTWVAFGHKAQLVHRPDQAPATFFLRPPFPESLEEFCTQLLAVAFQEGYALELWRAEP